MLETTTLTILKDYKKELLVKANLKKASPIIYMMKFIRKYPFLPQKSK